MKLYEITIKPTTGFGTPLKGDTFFGHFCWQAAYDSTILDKGLDHWVDIYKRQPFIIFSSAFPKFIDNGRSWYALKRPDLPMNKLFRVQGKDRCEMIKDRKEKKRLKWIRVEEDLCIDLKKATYLSDTNLAEESQKQATEQMKSAMKKSSVKGFSMTYEQQHNTINRLISTTGEGMFAPYTLSAISYYPETELSLFCLLDEEATDIERVQTAVERIGAFGFGRDASIGMGRFSLGEVIDIPIPESSGYDAWYTLSPCVPEKGVFSKIYYTPFVRFGRHGDVLAKSSNPFKNPVIMADEGAVFIPANKDVFNRPYTGTGITGVSKAEPRSIHQGYAIHLPVKIGGLP
ncbi:MAG: hypothetical protein JXM72_11935 [Deltaproteobacteria bacterium]|nr:hypothetical protein [Deltaproteobacteria bacterium]